MVILNKMMWCISILSVKGYISFFLPTFSSITTVGTDCVLLNLHRRNAMCGKLQCTNVDVNHPPAGAQVSIELVNGSRCINADFNLGTDVLDPAYVNPGSPCGAGKVSRQTILRSVQRDKEKECNQELMWLYLVRDSTVTVKLEMMTPNDSFWLHQ